MKKKRNLIEMNNVGIVVLSFLAAAARSALENNDVTNL
ncbi:hypothetical protein BH11BAC3_BH11BAC3_12980 [soil metagenome]